MERYKVDCVSISVKTLLFVGIVCVCVCVCSNKLLVILADFILPC